MIHPSATTATQPPRCFGDGINPATGQQIPRRDCGACPQEIGCFLARILDSLEPARDYYRIRREERNNEHRHGR
jgi:hypothetical protein